MTLRMVVGLDASPRAEEVLRAAVGLAKRMGGKLILLRTVGVPHEIPKEAYAMDPAQLSELLVSQSRDSLVGLGTHAPADVIEKSRVEVGTPWQVVCTVATEENADMIIIGSHGHSGLDRFLGTTAARVVDHADRSVLVIRMGELLNH